MWLPDLSWPMPSMQSMVRHGSWSLSWPGTLLGRYRFLEEFKVLSCPKYRSFLTGIHWRGSKCLDNSLTDINLSPPCFDVLVSMDELAKQSDFLAVCCALTPETREICNENLFSKMKKTSIFINTSRYTALNHYAPSALLWYALIISWTYGQIWMKS